MNVEAIRRLLLDSYIMPADDIDAQIQEWWDRDGSMDDGDAFVDQLVERQAMTSFQGTALRAGIPGPYKLGPYQVFDRIAGGRLGSVFRAAHEEFDQWVCLKVFPKSLNDSFEGSIRLARELRVAIQLDHPNLVRTYQVGRIGETVFMAIEDLQGETLADRLRREADNLTPELPQQESLRLAHQVSRGLAHLHSLGIVHRNIEPAAI